MAQNTGDTDASIYRDVYSSLSSTTRMASAKGLGWVKSYCGVVPAVELSVPSLPSGDCIVGFEG